MGRWIRFVPFVLGAFTLAGCGGGDDMGGGFATGSPGGEFGATQGGVQDMSFARELVEQGKVPPPSAFLVEAMFSEHDLPLSGAPCATTLCLRGAMGIAPDGAGKRSAWVQVGMSSTIDPATFERPSVALIATVDVSGSMGWGYPNANTPGETSRALLTGLVSRLGPKDRFALVTYGTNVNVPVPLVAGDDPQIQKAIDALHEAGSTNMEAGLKTAFSMAASAVGQADEIRVVLFTDVQPNVGATSATEFSTMAAAAAEQGVGLTVLGLGLGLGDALMTAMSGLRGGNAFSLMSNEDVPGFFEDNWPWLASPIAYGLSVSARPAVPLVLSEGYGFPVQQGAEEASFEVATVFLSKKKGALLLRLADPAGAAIEAASAELVLKYEDRLGSPHDQGLSVSYAGEPLDAQQVFMPQPSIDKAVSLAVLVSGMRAAAERCAKEPDGAAVDLQGTLARFQTDATRIHDAGIDEEAQFWPKLLDLMKAGAPQGSFYPEH